MIYLRTLVSTEMLAAPSVNDRCLSLVISADSVLEKQIRTNPPAHMEARVVAPHWFVRDPCGDAVKNKSHWVQMFLMQHQKANCLKARNSPLWFELRREEMLLLCRCSSFNQALTFSESVRECRRLKRGIWINVMRQQGSTLSCPHSAKPFPWESPAVCNLTQEISA